MHHYLQNQQYLHSAQSEVGGATGRLLAAYSRSSAARFVGDIALSFLSCSKYANSTLSCFQDDEQITVVATPLISLSLN